jgi:hypothetical protein
LFHRFGNKVKLISNFRQGVVTAKLKQLNMDTSEEFGGTWPTGPNTTLNN